MDDRIRLRAATLVIGALALLLPAGRMDAQQIAVGSRRAVANIEVNLSIPEFLRVRLTGRPEIVAKGANLSEFVVRLTVAANTAWNLDVEGTPDGVQILTASNVWSSGPEAIRVVAGEDATNQGDVEVRVRVATGAAVTWMDELRLVARSTALGAPTVTVASR
ncbi:MAG: hypothetical protein WD771_07970 [Gemmatimonadaceae bacterium]